MVCLIGVWGVLWRSSAHNQLLLASEDNTPHSNQPINRSQSKKRKVSFHFTLSFLLFWLIDCVAAEERRKEIL